MLRKSAKDSGASLDSAKLPLPMKAVRVFPIVRYTQHARSLILEPILFGRYSTAVRHVVSMKDKCAVRPAAITATRATKLYSMESMMALVTAIVKQDACLPPIPHKCYTYLLGCLRAGTLKTWNTCQISFPSLL